MKQIDVVNEEFEQEYCSAPPDNQPERDYKAFVTELTKTLGEDIDSKLKIAVDTTTQKIKTRLDKQQETLESITQSMQLVLFLFLVLVFSAIFK